MHKLKILCVGALGVVIAVLLAGPASAAPPGPRNDANALPHTGSSTLTLLLLGLALCAVGTVSVRATKRWGGTTD